LGTFVVGQDEKENKKREGGISAMGGSDCYFMKWCNLNVERREF
jgi:hypothetical protein